MNGPAVDCPVEAGCSAWIYKYIKDCVCSPHDRISFTLGMLSVACWGVAEVPQIFTNFREKSTEGVSLTFLMTWVIGDIFNLLGCYIEPATLPTQFYMALLYTITTCILVGQVIYYDHIYKSKRDSEEFLEPASPTAEKEQARAALQKPRTIPEVADEATETADSTHNPGNLQGAKDSQAPREQQERGIRVPRGASSRDLHYTSARSLASSHTPTGSYLFAWGSGGSHERSNFLHNASSYGSLSTLAVVQRGSSASGVHRSSSDAALRAVGSGVLMLGGFGLRASFTGGNRPKAHTHWVASSGRKLLQHPASTKLGSLAVYNGMLQDEASGSILGEIFGWCMAIIYMGGRIPQIWLNVKRGTVEGLNPLMFMFALLGNAFYVGSILVRSTEWPKIKPNMPWLVDAGVCVVLDSFILGQFIYYTWKSRQTKEVDEKGHYDLLR